MAQVPLVSVIIPTYNRASLLVETIESILAQTYPDFEVIVIDDGSTDGTKAAVESIASGASHTVRYYWQENQGVSAATNKGISLAKGALLAFCDSDDKWHAIKLSRQVAFLRDNPSCDLVLCDLESFGGKSPGSRIFDGLRLESGRLLNELFATNFCSLVAVLVRREVFDKVGFFQNGLEFSQDYDMFLRMAVEHKFGIIKERLAFFRIHEGRMTNDPTSPVRRYQVLRKFLRRHPKRVPPKIVSTRLHEVAANLGDIFVKLGRGGVALRYLLESVRYGMPSAKIVKNLVKAMMALVV